MYDNMNTELKSNVQNHNMNKQESKKQKKNDKTKEMIGKNGFPQTHKKRELYCFKLNPSPIEYTMS